MGTKKIKVLLRTIILVLILTCSISAFDPPSCGDSWYYQTNDRGLTFMVPDKAQHYWGSYVLNEVCGKVLGKELGAAMTFALGFIWEVKDSETSLGTANSGVVGFSYRDLIADGLGVVSSLVNNSRTVVMYVDYSTAREEISFNIAMRW